MKVMKIFLIAINVIIVTIFLALTFIYVGYADVSTDAIEKIFGVDGLAIWFKNIALFLIAYASGTITAGCIIKSMKFYRRFNKKKSPEA